ncbi:phospholipase [Sulfitobacter sp. JL08]|uniref:phospholipase D family protein n=1 Tax=Sulfitobacter sp. JL08 TaxID=2070369 RepID=UPI000E0BBCE8|nr:phospholipase D family protein [Sulfitobacter sp. JL08]AXI53615.1 phospholipase [Sulfitobacter sp. JL08]
MNSSDISLKTPVTNVRLLITAEEAYPAMEQAFLEAREEIWAGYRIFDLSTRLRSKAAQRIGTDWFDLMVHVLKRGVAVHMVLSDFDPVVGHDLHCTSWRSRRAFVAAAEVAGPRARLRVINALHTARAGLLPKALLWPGMYKKLREHADRLNAMNEDSRERVLECSPGLRILLRWKNDDVLSARPWPPCEIVPATHHQKMAVFDRKTLCIGGLDLDERRYDDLHHQRQRDETWHDVQMMCEGAVVKDAQKHLEDFLYMGVGAKAAPSNSRFLTTLSVPRKMNFPYLSPHPVATGLAQTHHRLAREARNLIYLETQYFRDQKFAKTLARAARLRPELSLILTLPAAPDDVAFEGSTSTDARYGENLQAKCLATLKAGFGDRVVICSPVRPHTSSTGDRDELCGSPIIYVHAKVSVFDEDAAIISSANLNGRSFYWDTEAGVLIEDAATVRAIRQRVFGHWLGQDAGPEFYDPLRAVVAWRGLVEQNATCAPDKRTGFLVPHDTQPAEQFGRAMPGLTEDIV